MWLADGLTETGLLWLQVDEQQQLVGSTIMTKEIFYIWPEFKQTRIFLCLENFFIMLLEKLNKKLKNIKFFQLQDHLMFITLCVVNSGDELELN